MSFVHPSSGERFYLRTLLTIVKGAKDWDDLKRFNGVLHPTYKAACLARGLLEDDGEWNQCLQEAGQMQTGGQLRTLFAVLLLHCHPTEPAVLWDHHKVNLCDDLRHKLIALHNIPDPTDDQVYDHGLYLIDQILCQSGKDLSMFPPMPTPQENWVLQDNDNQLLQEQLQYDEEDLLVQVYENEQRLNDEQRPIYDAVLQSVDNQAGDICFLHSAGGGGKTFVCNSIAAAVHSKKCVALTVASSAVAALLLEGGRTAHSRFKIPIPIHESSTCRIEKHGDLAQVLRQTAIIIYDEAPMQDRYIFEALNRTLQDIRDSPRLFGGITMLFGGDFRQTTPVIARASRERIVNASIKKSFLWNHTKVFHLKQNMRLDRTPESEAFAAWLLEVGAGGPSSSINLPQNMHLQDNTVNGLVNALYPNLEQGNHSDDYFLHRTILSPKNDTVDEMNQSILDRYLGEQTIITSVDKVTSNDFQNVYPLEFLHSLKASGLPLANLALKPGCPLMLLRNLDVTSGLCNGTRMILLEIKPRVLRCRILGGKYAGNIVFIPRITIEPSAEDMPIPLSRRQYPVRLAFAMTINKSQGQSVVNVGVDLRIPVFSHGQLYVALSRCTSGDRIKVLFAPGSDSTSTSNIVYRELLTGILDPWYVSVHFLDLLIHLIFSLDPGPFSVFVFV